MPDMWTHLVGGKRAVELIHDPAWRRNLADHANMFNFGCQAPDLFYYYNFQPWKRDKIGGLVSAVIHLERCQDFVVSLVHNLKPHEPSFLPDVAFVLGFICHWVLDRVTHPYVHYVAGFGNRFKASTVHSATAHKRLELLIDVLMAEKHLGKKPYRDSLIDEISVGREIPASVAHMLKSAIASTYPTVWGVQRPNCVESCYRDMLISINWLYDPHGHKKRFFWGVLDKLFGIASLTYFYPREVTGSHDYLNELRQEWSHPACAEEVSTESFHDLLDRAVQESSELMDATICYLQGQISETAWTNTLGNLSYSTGKECSQHTPLIHSRPLPVL